VKKLNCPHCGNPGISILRKFFLGPAAPATCGSCRKRVGVPYTAVLAAIPFFAAMLATPLVEPFPLKVVLLVSGVSVTTIIHMLWTPLEPR
jgi:hypothetical protein